MPWSMVLPMFVSVCFSVPLSRKRFWRLDRVGAQNEALQGWHYIYCSFSCANLLASRKDTWPRRAAQRKELENTHVVFRNGKRDKATLLLFCLNTSFVDIMHRIWYCIAYHVCQKANKTMSCRFCELHLIRSRRTFITWIYSLNVSKTKLEVYVWNIGKTK